MKLYKFRAWDKELKTFSYFDFSNALPCYSDSNNWIVQQFTGFFDKNDAPIYEGDILNFDL